MYELQESCNADTCIMLPWVVNSPSLSMGDQIPCVGGKFKQKECKPTTLSGGLFCKAWERADLRCGVVFARPLGRGRLLAQSPALLSLWLVLAVVREGPPVSEPSSALHPRGLDHR